MRLGSWECIVKPGTQAWDAYDKANQFIDKEKGLTSERHRHRFEVNDDFLPELEKQGLVISGRSVQENLVEIIELPKSMHPFFLGTQGHPEYKSDPLHPNPIFVSYIHAAKVKKA
jgi:CTP synthase